MKFVPKIMKKLNRLSQMAKDLNCGNEKECTIFKKKLKDMDFKYFAVEKDGHCQFGAVLPHLKEDEFTVMDMRCEVTYVLLQLLRQKDECEEYQQLCTMECSEINKLMKDCLQDLYTGEQWGDHLTARLICEIYKINLFVITEAKDVFPIWNDNNFSKTVHVILVNQHYTGTEPNVELRDINDGNDTAESEIMAKGKATTVIGEDENVSKVTDDMDSTEGGDVNNDVQATSDVDNMVVDEEITGIENEVTHDIMTNGEGHHWHINSQCLWIVNWVYHHISSSTHCNKSHTLVV